MNTYKKGVTFTLIAACVLTALVFLGRLDREAAPPAPTAEQAVEQTLKAPPAEPEIPAGATEEPKAPEPEEREPLMASPHFAMEEYRCDCTGYCDGWPCAMRPELLEKIEALRCSYERPIIITSGVRCEARNEEVGGVSWSFHKRGCAADLYCPGIGVGDLAQTAKELGLNVLPYYGSGYIHVEIIP
ncbi:YcbK family protein [Eubacterium limosum]|uniref:YcbK family protein n=1 Tax=Eubacterium limosum TaxID=1736 RepID=UPI0010631564|nr:D-Ala-D-Ala carboxypeptidase family metallohydrolase [Eubacterium limosum]